MEQSSKQKVVRINKNKSAESAVDFLSQPHKTYSLNHNVCAIYSDSATADEACEHLIDQGFVESEITILKDQFPNHGHSVIGSLDDEVLTLTCVDFGTNRTAIMISANVTLFIAKHLLKSLAWNNTLITVNAIVTGALKTGGVLLHIQTEYESDKELAKEILSDSLEQDKVELASNQ